MEPNIIAVLGASLVTGVFVLFLTPAVRRYSVRRGLNDQAEVGRKRARRGIPRFGGFAIGIGIGMGGIALVLVGADATKDLWPLFAGAYVLWLVGLIDDFKGVGYKRKFLIQVLVAYALVLSGWKLDLTPIPYFGTLGSYEQAVIIIPVLMLWLVGVMNAINITDGQDGLAAGISTIAFMALAVIAGAQGQWQLVAFCIVASVALVSFLVYNWSPASIFMGDSGSLFLGFLLAALSLRIAAASTTAWGMIAPCVVLGLPLLDIVSSMVRRILNNQSPFAADLDHIHHRVVRAAGSVRLGILVLYAVGLLFGGLGVAVSLTPWPWPVIAIGFALVLCYLMLWRLSYIWIHLNLRPIRRHWPGSRRIVVAPAELATRAPAADTQKAENTPSSPEILVSLDAKKHVM